MGYNIRDLWKPTMVMSVVVGTLSWISEKKVDSNTVAETNFESTSTPKNVRQPVARQLLQWADKEICGGRVKPKNNIAYSKIEEILHCGVTNLLVEQVAGWGL